MTAFTDQKNFVSVLPALKIFSESHLGRSSSISHGGINYINSQFQRVIEALEILFVIILIDDIHGSDDKTADFFSAFFKCTIFHICTLLFLL